MLRLHQMPSHLWKNCHFSAILMPIQRKAESDVRRIADLVNTSPQILKEAIHLLRAKALRACVVEARMPVDLVAGQITLLRPRPYQKRFMPFLQNSCKCC